MLQDAGHYYQLLEDISFNSPSGAASFILGRSANGRIEWLTPEGETYAQWEEKGL